jgi:hypothetical protein
LLFNCHATDVCYTAQQGIFTNFGWLPGKGRETVIVCHFRGHRKRKIDGSREHSAIRTLSPWTVHYIFGMPLPGARIGKSPLSPNANANAYTHT